MIVVRFRMVCKAASAERVMAALKDVVNASRRLEGVVSFDIGRDVADPNVFIATEVFANRDALERQESLPEVAKVMGVFENALAADPEATIFHISSSEPWG